VEPVTAGTRLLGRYDSYRKQERVSDERETHVGTTEARAGTTPHMTRYILPISLGMVVIVFALILLLWQ
jgi:hypothetical protein